MTASGKNLMSGLLKTETRALIVGAGLLIAGAFLGVSGFVDGDVAILIAGSVLTLVSIYITFSAFLRYQWQGVVEDAKLYYEMSKVATADALEEMERKRSDKS